MGFLDKLFGRKKKETTPSSGDVARERLTLMLVHDRLKLTPDLIGRIKEDMLAVISKYVEIDESGVEIELTHTEHMDRLVARMPVKRQRIQFQRDVLEPGMGNPLAAAAALAKLHQPPASAASHAAEAAPDVASKQSAGDMASQSVPTLAEAAPPAADQPQEPPVAAAQAASTGGETTPGTPSAAQAEAATGTPTPGALAEASMPAAEADTPARAESASGAAEAVEAGTPVEVVMSAGEAGAMAPTDDVPPTNGASEAALPAGEDAQEPVDPTTEERAAPAEGSASDAPAAMVGEGAAASEHGAPTPPTPEEAVSETPAAATLPTKG